MVSQGNKTMKKIINKKLYNTDTATEVTNFYYSTGGFDQFSETLYQKKTGEYFLYGEGGPASKYAERVPTGGCMEGEKIVPLTDKEAQEWAEENLEADEVIELFGEYPE